MSDVEVAAGGDDPAGNGVGDGLALEHQVSLVGLTLGGDEGHLPALVRPEHLEEADRVDGLVFFVRKSSMMSSLPPLSLPETSW